VNVVEEIKMKSIIEEIEKLKEEFEVINHDHPNCVKVGKREVCELENWYDTISKQDSNTKKVKINDGVVIMGLYVVKTKDKTFLEVAKENLASKTWRAVILNPEFKVQVEVKNEEGNK